MARNCVCSSAASAEEEGIGSANCSQARAFDLSEQSVLRSFGKFGNLETGTDRLVLRFRTEQIRSQLVGWISVVIELVGLDKKKAIK